MRGVHASCVEKWIAYHRQDGLSSGPPRCSVCHQPYLGHEEHPGASTVAWRIWRDSFEYLSPWILFSMQVLFRAMFLLPSEALNIAPHWRGVMIVSFWLISVHEMVVLTVSLRPPPQNFLLLFHFEEFEEIDTYALDIIASLVHIAASCYAGTSCQWYHLLPFLTVFILMVSPYTVLDGQTQRRLWQTLFVVLIASGLEFHVYTAFGVLFCVYEHPKMFLHPCDAGWHICLAVASPFVCRASKSNVPVMVLLAVHSMLIAVILYEQLCIKRCQWRAGPTWGGLSAVALYVVFDAAFCNTFTSGVAYSGVTPQCVVAAQALAWAALVVGLAAQVNRTAMVVWYQNWQRSHGHFRLDMARQDKLEGCARMQDD